MNQDITTELLGIVVEAAGRADVQLVVIGAFARDVHIRQSSSTICVTRATIDVDVACKVTSLTRPGRVLVCWDGT